MPNVEVTLLRTKFAKSWPKYECGESADVLPLSEVLTHAYATDTHFSAYVTPIERRLSQEAIAPLAASGARIDMTVLVFDLDDVEAKRDLRAASDTWRKETRAKMARLCAVHPGCFYYETKGGARIVYALPAPVQIASVDDARAWSCLYIVACAYLERRFAIIADVACRDWTRVFRAARATREGSDKPENGPMEGDPHAIAALVFEPEAADLARAGELVPAAFAEPRKPEPHLAVRFRDKYELGRVERWALAALENELATLMNTPRGERNNRLRDAAVKLGGLVHLGFFTADDVRRELEWACSHWHARDQRHDHDTVERGLRFGLAHPRMPPTSGRAA